jgi:hypothetical protein
VASSAARRTELRSGRRFGYMAKPEGFVTAQAFGGFGNVSEHH